MNDSLLRVRLERVEQLLDHLAIDHTKPDFAAVWASMDRIADFLLTVWRVAVINGVHPSALGFPAPEGFALPPAPSSADTQQWHDYRETIWDRLIGAVTDDPGPGEAAESTQEMSSAQQPVNSDIVP